MTLEITGVRIELLSHGDNGGGHGGVMGGEFRGRGGEGVWWERGGNKIR